MNTTISMWLGIAFLGLAIAAVLLQAWLWGPKYWNEELKKTEAPRFWLRVHALCGYFYAAIYVVMMWNMLPRLWEYQYELPARTVFHAVFGITIGVLLVCKITIVLFFRHFEESMPYYGFGLLLCTVILSTLSIPYALQAHDFSGRTTDPDNVERVRKLLANVDFGDQEVDIDELTTEAGFERGRQILVKQCIVCHDMRTILAQPRTPQKWHDVSLRMLEKPSVFGDQLEPADIPPVTAYLAAITPEIQQSTKDRRKLERTDEDNTDAMVALAHAATPAADMPKIDESTGEALLQEHCTACHELDENDNHGPDDLAGWRSVVAAMVEEGAELDDEQAVQIAAYLAQKYPATGEENPPLPPAPDLIVMAEEDEADTDAEGDDDTGGETEGAAEDSGDAGSGGEADEGDSGGEAVVAAAPEPKVERKRKRKRKPKSSDGGATKAKQASTPSGDAANGRTLFMAKCKTCHGADGKGDTAFGRKLELTPLSGLGNARIRSAVANGVPGTKMKPYKGSLSSQEIDDLVSFVRRL